MSRKKRPDDERPPHPKGLVYFLKDGRLISPAEQFGNLLDALLHDELLDTEVEIDPKRVEQARKLVQAAIKEALATSPQKPGNKRPAAIRGDYKGRREKERS